MLTFFTLLGMFLITVFVAGAALRDFDAGTGRAVLRHADVAQGDYLGGRFAAGYRRRSA